MITAINPIRQLSDVCAIHSGYTARSRLENHVATGILTLQLRDISSSGRIEPERLSRAQLQGLSDHYFVQEGDVVFRSRGEHNTATALDDRFRERVVAILPLIVVRPKREFVIAEYVAWAINQSASQRYFDTVARGTSIRMIPKSSLDELQIVVPSIPIQQRIVMLDKLAERENELALNIAEKRRNLMRLIIEQQISVNRPSEISKRT